MQSGDGETYLKMAAITKSLKEAYVALENPRGLFSNWRSPMYSCLNSWMVP